MNYRKVKASEPPTHTNEVWAHVSDEGAMLPCYYDHSDKIWRLSRDATPVLVYDWLEQINDEWVSVEDIRTAIANYMASEGCSCCQDVTAHREHENAIGKLLNMEPYSDGSGYDFSKYRKGYMDDLKELPDKPITE